MTASPATGECDVAGDAVLPNPVGDKFRAVVRVEAAQDQGQSRVDLVEGEGDAALALAQHGARLAPAGVDIGQVERMMNSPSAEVPEWETRSTSVKPGRITAQWSVLTGIWCFRRAPGLVRR